MQIMVIDVITYNGEEDLYEIRFNMLEPFVDQFIVVEANKTFSGNNKPLYFTNHKRFKEKKIKYFVVEDWGDAKLWDMAFTNKATKGVNHWKQEFYIKESLKKALVHLNDDDICFIGDCDEIWDYRNIILNQKIKLKVYAYWLNNRSNEEFWGGIWIKYGNIKDACLNDLRNDLPKSEMYGGWHFTSLKDGLKRKLTDSYTEESYANKSVMDNLDENIKNNRDFLGRDFEFKIDESEWPNYLKQNKDKYIDLCKK